MTSASYRLSSKYSADPIARDAWVEIDLNKLEFNVQQIKATIERQTEKGTVKKPKIMASVKGDAYGHGAATVSQVLESCGVSWFGVASVDEGRELRDADCKLPILVLSPTPAWAIKRALDNKLDLTISSLYQLQEVMETLKEDPRSVSLHLKVDTGMHRLGMNQTDVKKALALLKVNKKFKLISIYSHLAKASEISSTKKQKKFFDQFISICESEKVSPDFFHLSSSEAAQHFPFVYYDLVRIGISLYGLEAKCVSDNLLPIMSVRGRINQINEIDKGESVGYGFTWQANRRTRLANIPIGYADGVSRGLSNKMKGLLHNQLIDQVGTISMDQMLFDITDVEDAKEGDVITIVGSDDYIYHLEDKSSCDKQIYLADWAEQLQTITYELATKLKVRLPRIYTRNKLKYYCPENSFAPKNKGK